jgi:hypothetical protein
VEDPRPCPPLLAPSRSLHLHRLPKPPVEEVEEDEEVNVEELHVEELHVEELEEVEDEDNFVTNFVI